MKFKVKNQNQCHLLSLEIALTTLHICTLVWAPDDTCFSPPAHIALLAP